MRFIEGNKRYVLVFPDDGFVLKFPIIYWGSVLGRLKTGRSRHRQRQEGMKRGQWFSEFLWEELFGEHHATFEWKIREFLFAGFVENWRERQYYRLSTGARRRLLQPTWFSFFGLVNIQKYGMPSPQPRTVADLRAGKRIYDRLFDIAGEDLNMDGHHFAYNPNFHICGSRLKFLDYGGLETQCVIDKYAEQFAEIKFPFEPPDL